MCECEATQVVLHLTRILIDSTRGMISTGEQANKVKQLNIAELFNYVGLSGVSAGPIALMQQVRPPHFAP
jgi:hypothetical protein